MKKFISGLVVGVILTTTFSAFANNTMIGKKVNSIYPLIINGTKAQKDVIVIEGTSYLPVRVAGELFGYNVDFKDSQVLLNNKDSDPIDTIQYGAIEVKSNIITVSGNHEYFIKQNEGYIGIAAISNYVEYGPESNLVTISLPGQQPFVFYKNQEDNIDLMFKDKRHYIRLSALGLKGVLKENVLWIEKL